MEEHPSIASGPFQQGGVIMRCMIKFALRCPGLNRFVAFHPFLPAGPS